jgi:PAS domain S-box-containing protein
VVTVGALALVGGWLFGVEVLRRPVPATGVGVKPLAAVCLLLIGVSLRLAVPGAGRGRRLVAATCAATVTSVGLVALAEYCFGVDAGVDRLLFPHAVLQAGGPYPGRPAVDAAVAFVLCGTALLAVGAARPRVVLASQGLAAGVVVLAGTSVYSSLYGLLYGQPRLRTPSAVVGMAFYVGVALTLVGAAVLAARPDVGFARLTSRSTAGGRLGRRIMVAALSVPFGLGLLPMLAAGPHAPYETRLVVAFLVTGNALVLGGTGLLAAHATVGRELACARAEQAEHEAREGNDRLFKVIDNTSAVIYMRDSDGRYLLINRQYEQLFDLARDNIVGLTDHDLFPKDMADDFRANDLKALATGAPVQMEEVAPHPDGPHTYITVKYPITNSAGKPYAVCGISTDITDLKRAEAEVRRLNAELELRVRHRTAELETSTRELDAFAYSVSHDLRAPLRALDGFSQVLIEDYAERLDDTGRDYLRRVQAATGRMGQLIDDLLDLSRATRVELTRQQVDLGQLAHDVVVELRSAEPGRDVELTTSDRLSCQGDPHLLQLVLHNLISNAWKFTSKQARGSIHVGSAEEDGEDVFFVRDNGAGFDPRYADKLFVPFQRLHTADDFPGSGVGLAIVARIVNRHGGRAWAEGEPDGGATFFFTVTPPPEKP